VARGLPVERPEGDGRNGEEVHRSNRSLGISKNRASRSSGGLLSLKFKLVHSDPDPIQAHDHALVALREFFALIPCKLLFF